ncbi:MAG: hypothetical protein JNM43_06945 [Planctomycetaceae bacterium]|nr:hypothetical protein [Planctomycetaceae bacterium]
MDDQQLAYSFGMKNIGGGDMLAVRTFMTQMLTNKTEALDRIRRLSGERNLGYATSNLATLLSDTDMLRDASNLRQMDLHGAVIRTSQIADKEVDGSVFSGTSIYIDSSREFSNGCLGRGVITGLPFVVGVVDGEWDLAGVRISEMLTYPWPVNSLSSYAGFSQFLVLEVQTNRDRMKGNYVSGEIPSLLSPIQVPSSTILGLIRSRQGHRVNLVHAELDAVQCQQYAVTLIVDLAKVYEKYDQYIREVGCGEL